MLLGIEESDDGPVILLSVIAYSSRACVFHAS